MVSLIQSNYGLFGSGIGVEGGGFVFHNRAALFTGLYFLPQFLQIVQGLSALEAGQVMELNVEATRIRA